MSGFSFRQQGFFSETKIFAARRWGTKKPRHEGCVTQPVHRENDDANTQVEDTKHTSISITANHTGRKALRMHCVSRAAKFGVTYVG